MPRRVTQFPSLVDKGENPRAECVAHVPYGTLHNGVGGDGPAFHYWPPSGDGERWGYLGEDMLRPIAPTLTPYGKSPK